MRILQICQRPQRRGAEVFAFQLSAELEKRGHEVLTAYLYPFEGEGCLPLRSQDRILGADDSHPMETSIGFRPSLLRRVRRLVKEYQPDITQVNGARSVKYGVLASALNGAAAGAVVYRNIGSVTDWVRGPRRKMFYRYILRRVDGVAAISEESRAALSGVFSKPTPVAVISNAIDPESLRPRVPRTELRSDSSTPLSAVVVIFVGSLAPEKRVDRLIRALGEVRAGGCDLYLWVVGEGPLRSDLAKQVREAELEEATRFFGSQDDVASFMAAADMLALVSDTEGIPGVVLEAGYLGLPVVATNVGGIPECVEDGVTGLLLESGDGEALVAALTRVANDRELRVRLGSAARKRITERHSIHRIADEFVDFYETVRGDRSAGGQGSETPTRESEQLTLPPEMRLVTLLARSSLSADIETRVHELLKHEIDWDTLLLLAQRHRLSPLVATHLRDFRELVPSAVEEDLARRQFSNAVSALKQTGQLFEALDAFLEAGVTAVPYKGPALGAQLYGSGALRIFGDLDVVVRPPDVSEARRILKGLGYVPRIVIDDTTIEFMIRHRYHEEFRRDDDGLIELHWGFANREIAFDLDLEQAWMRLHSVEMNERDVPTFHPEDLLLILSIHGAKHRWDRLEWLAGVAELLRQSQELDWDRVLSRASSLGVLRTVALGLDLAVKWLEAPVPASVTSRIRSDERLPRLVEHVEELLARPPAGWELADRLQRDRFRILLQERFRDRLRFAWNRAITPSDPNEWDLTRVGPSIIPVHALRRPFHFLNQLLQAWRTPRSSQSR